MNKKILYLIQFFIMVLLVYWFYITFYSENTLTILSQANPLYILFAIMAVLSEIVTRSCRWIIPLSRSNNTTIRNSKIIGCVAMSYMISDFTPSRTGDVVAIIILNKLYKIKTAMASAVIYFEKLFDLSLLGLSVVLSITLLYSFKTDLKLNQLLITSLLTIFVILITPILLTRKNNMQIITKIIKPIVSEVIKEEKSNEIYMQIYNLADVFNTSLKRFISFKVIMGVGMSTIAVWFFYCLRFYLISKSINLNFTKIPFYTFAIITIFIFSISIIPVSIGGIGIKEISAVYIFCLVGFNADILSTAVILDRVIYTAIHLITGLPLFLQYIQRSSAPD